MQECTRMESPMSWLEALAHIQLLGASLYLLQEASITSGPYLYYDHTIKRILKASQQLYMTRASVEQH